MPTNSLPGAIVAAFLGDGGCTTQYPGGIWEGEAEEGTALPYCELAISDGEVLQTSDKPYVETTPVVFTTWAAGLTVAETAAAAVLTLFNRVTPAFSLDTDRLIAFLLRSPSAPQPSERRDQNGNQVWRLDIRFDAMVQRSKTT